MSAFDKWVEQELSKGLVDFKVSLKPGSSQNLEQVQNDILELERQVAAGNIRPPPGPTSDLDENIKKIDSINLEDKGASALIKPGMYQAEIKQVVMDICAQYPFTWDGEEMDMTGLRPDQIAFYEALRRGDHLDTILLPLTV